MAAVYRVCCGALREALEEAGIIDRYVAVLDPVKAGLPLFMFARVWLTAEDAETIDHFMEAMKKLPQVMQCYIMLRERDALMRVVVSDLDDYRQFQSTHLTRVNGIQNVKTDVPSQIVKQTYALPLRQMRDASRGDVEPQPAFRSAISPCRARRRGEVMSPVSSSTMTA
ncbi:Lrp/AsnC family transcriptional regulator [Rhizobium jaguaris]|uniref:Lrp/AsnC family transcriptional regulator n=1 Tax=Rhizobium jaguaris TaxID=1312183 RepID=UPI001FE0B43B|nr:Lrp/AsnC family transcriptional regulator [Rhizobium jaguaris]